MIDGRKSKLNPEEATRTINKIAGKDGFRPVLTNHARERLVERDIPIGDLSHLLRNGTVSRDARKSEVKGDWIYRIEGRTPNSGQRRIAAAVIPDAKKPHILIITVIKID